VGILQLKKNPSPGRPGKDQRKGGIWRLSGAIIPGSRFGFIHAHHYALCGFFGFISLLKDFDYDPLPQPSGPVLSRRNSRNQFLPGCALYNHLCFGPGDQAGSRRQPRLGSKAGQKIQVCLRRRRRGVSSRLIHGKSTASGCQAKRLGPPGWGSHFNFGTSAIASQGNSQPPHRAGN